MAPGIRLRAAAQQLEGPGVPQQGQHAVGDQVDRGIMTGDEYQQRIGQDLVGRHGSIRAVVVQHL